MSDLQVGDAVVLVADSEYHELTIPAGTCGTLAEDDGDCYHPYVVEFDGYPDAYFVARGYIEQVAR